MVREKVSEQEQTEFVAALGRALAQWSTIENQLYLLYMALCKPGVFPSTHSIIYETIVHLDNKLSIIDALLAFRTQDAEILAKWTNLQAKIKRSARKVRNKLAHWPVWNSTDEKHYPIFLGPPLSGPAENVEGFGTSHGGAMNTATLNEHAARFSELGLEVSQFTKKYDKTWRETSVTPNRVDLPR